MMRLSGWINAFIIPFYTPNTNAFANMGEAQETPFTDDEEGI